MHHIKLTSQEKVQETEKSSRSSKNYTILYNGSQDSDTSERKKSGSKLLHNMSSGVETTTSSRGML